MQSIHWNTAVFFYTLLEPIADQTKYSLNFLLLKHFINKVHFSFVVSNPIFRQNNSFEPLALFTGLLNPNFKIYINNLIYSYILWYSIAILIICSISKANTKQIKSKIAGAAAKWMRLLRTLWKKPYGEWTEMKTMYITLSMEQRATQIQLYLISLCQGTRRDCSRIYKGQRSPKFVRI